MRARDGAVFQRRPVKPHDSPDRLVPWREVNEFRGNDFTDALLRSPDFRGGVILPDNSWPTYGCILLDRWQERLVHAIAAVSRWDNVQEGERALWWVRLHRSSGRELQDTNLIRPEEWNDIEPRTIWVRLWELLTRPMPGA